jgi:predicted protein tyrosine phosphatase
MRIEIYPRYAISDIKTREDKYGLISITEPTANFTDYPSGDPHLMGILAIKFSDVVEELDIFRDGQGRVIMRPMDRSQARLILDFSKSMEGQVDSLLINCDAGVSRSAAVGAALLRINGEDDSHIWNSSYHYPNEYVYKLLLEVAGYEEER